MNRDETGRQHVHIVVDADLWKQFKIDAIKSDETMTSLLEKLLKERLGAEEASEEEVESKGGLKGGSVLTPLTPKADTGGSNGSSLVAVTAPRETEKLRPGTHQYVLVKEVYNAVARESKSEGLPGFSTCRRLDTGRKRGIDRLTTALVESGHSIDHLFPGLAAKSFTEYFRKCMQNRHWRGGNDRGWRADIEFLTRDSTISKALEIEDETPQPAVAALDPPAALERAKGMARQWVEKEDATDYSAFSIRFSEELDGFLQQNRLPAERENLLEYFHQYYKYFTSAGGTA